MDSARGSVFISISNVFKLLLQISMFMILFEWLNVVAIGSNGDGDQRDHAIGSRSPSPMVQNSCMQWVQMVMEIKVDHVMRGSISISMISYGFKVVLQSTIV